VLGCPLLTHVSEPVALRTSPTHIQVIRLHVTDLSGDNSRTEQHPWSQLGAPGRATPSEAGHVGRIESTKARHAGLKRSRLQHSPIIGSETPNNSHVQDRRSQLAVAAGAGAGASHGGACSGLALTVSRLCKHRQPKHRPDRSGGVTSDGRRVNAMSWKLLDSGHGPGAGAGASLMQLTRGSAASGVDQTTETAIPPATTSTGAGGSGNGRGSGRGVGGSQQGSKHSVE